MKNYLIIGFTSFAILFNACTNGQTQNTKTNLSATEFSEKIKEQPTAPILDVRTPEEFLSGHIQNAKNINWNGNDFDKLRFQTGQKESFILRYSLLVLSGVEVFGIPYSISRLKSRGNSIYKSEWK